MRRHRAKREEIHPTSASADSRDVAPFAGATQAIE
jgi:hypothetical protein